MNRQCRICASDVKPWIQAPIDPKSGKPTRFGDTWLCEKCDIGMVLPVCSADELRQFYNLEKYYTQSGSHFIAKPDSFLDRVLTKAAWWLDQGEQLGPEQINARFPSPGSVCDIGCGEGHLLSGLQALGWRVCGIEPDPVAKSHGEQAAFRIFNGTAEKIPMDLPEGTFDLVVMSHVLEHCMTPQLAISNAYKLLRPGGLFMIEVPNKDALHFRMFRAASDCYDIPRHQYFFGLNALNRMLETANFRVVEEYYHGLTRHHLPGWRATEQKIRLDIKDAGTDAAKIPPEHTLLRSAQLLLWEMISPKATRYDAIGIWGKKG